VNGQRVAPQLASLYILLHKPSGTISSVSDPEGRRTVLDVLPEPWRKQRVYPVGRLDWDTEGLLILTNDGEFALRLTHPRYALEKEYHVLIAGALSQQTVEQLERGIRLGDGGRPTAPARVTPLRQVGDATWISIVIHEGRNRQVRRMLEAVGVSVLRLRRVRIGPLALGPLPVGDARLLTPHEVRALRQASADKH